TPPPPVLLTGPSNQVVVAGSAITLAVTVAGTGPFTYQWQFNGVNLPNDIISTVAGNGSGSFSGDGGLATNASLNAPATVALDAAGNLSLADFWNNRVRKVTPAGIITTVAGNGIGDFSGDGGAATNASLNAPYALAVAPSGSLCVADLSNHRIRKVTPDGIITTVAGSGTNGFAGDGGAATNAMLYDPEGLTFDRSGNLFIA